MKPKNIYVIMYQIENVEGVFTTMKAVNNFFKDNEIPKEVREEEFRIIKTELYNN